MLDDDSRLGWTASLTRPARGASARRLGHSAKCRVHSTHADNRGERPDRCATARARRPRPSVGPRSGRSCTRRWSPPTSAPAAPGGRATGARSALIRRGTRGGVDRRDRRQRLDAHDRAHAARQAGDRPGDQGRHDRRPDRSGRRGGDALAAPAVDRQPPSGGPSSPIPAPAIGVPPPKKKADGTTLAPHWRHPSRCRAALTFTPALPHRAARLPPHRGAPITPSPGGELTQRSIESADAPGSCVGLREREEGSGPATCAQAGGGRIDAGGLTVPSASAACRRASIHTPSRTDNPGPRPLATCGRPRPWHHVRERGPTAATVQRPRLRALAGRG